MAVWAQMQFKPKKKLRGLVYTGERVTKKFQYMFLYWNFNSSFTDRSCVSRTEKQANKWLERSRGHDYQISPRPESSIMFFCQLHLSRSSMVEEFRVAKCKVRMMYQDSNHEKVRNRVVTVRSRCRQWHMQ